jgi:hypothetical protein
VSSFATNQTRIQFRRAERTRDLLQIQQIYSKACRADERPARKPLNK